MKLYEHVYRVCPTRGRSFPFDMLRYDGSTIATEVDSSRIERTIRGERLEDGESVGLRHLGADRNWRPNADRWESFGWHTGREGAMSNVKRVRIEGLVAFDYYNDAQLAQQFAFAQSPSSGFDVQFSATTTTVPNEHGGRTTLYGFVLEGDEAVRAEWCDRFVRRVNAGGGEVTVYHLEDLEAAQGGGAPRGEQLVRASSAAEVLSHLKRVAS